MGQSSHICSILNEPKEARTTACVVVRAGSLAHGGPYRGCRSPVLVRFAVTGLIARHIWNVHPRRRLPSHFISLFNVIFFYNKYAICGLYRFISTNLLFTGPLLCSSREGPFNFLKLCTSMCKKWLILEDA